MKAFLVLENGDVYEGESFGYETQSVGEIVFNTSLAGYQEILTDPSYADQIITLTYPMIGNYGISPEYMESSKIQASGMIVKEYVDRPSNFKSEKTLSQFLKEYKIPGIQGIDTRKLTRFIRTNGAPNGGIFVAEEYSNSFLEKVKRFPGIANSDLAKIVSTNHKYEFGTIEGKKYKLAVYDYGVKTNILRLLDAAGFAVTVYPAETSADEIMKDGVDAFFLSNGPGDPAACTYAIESTRAILEKGYPLFGICLGHQIIGLAMGKKTEKMKFGHRGGNQPVKNMATGRVEITSQNHGFAVVAKSSEKEPVSFVNLNDETVEGILKSGYPLLSVQYHPESAPGPNDSRYLFKKFYDLVDSTKNGLKLTSIL
ncbi:carbamoyl-phosphate synthase, small subunit [Leptospira inadai serovar Lyme str. 10]|uniref:Carbamoyl phosphate synthase small chain n=2 Tax=Leptospira inadai serovar Lyme TaxID=293084 RepID=V6HNX9_9LEPT|nr:glutamine-hydrolyzing carbamoyl-phosphate synthase small subunit [Leptospira inadai]EQA38575.1 carbamoyl-phosphate synthase, small subunit [Leptospira inadai serovar Lyme str. 10]PNV72392.1 carbamoyl-phosphate synthase small subunit [Leptospira inadai serovar Lyme]